MYDPAPPPPGADPREVRPGARTDICTPVLTAGSFTTAARWQRAIGGEAGKRRAIRPHTEYDSAVQRKDVLTLAMT